MWLTTSYVSGNDARTTVPTRGCHSTDSNKNCTALAARIVPVLLQLSETVILKAILDLMQISWGAFLWPPGIQGALEGAKMALFILLTVDCLLKYPRKFSDVEDM